MVTTVTALSWLTLAPIYDLPTSFWQCTPVYKEQPSPRPDKPRAVVLIHGLVPRPTSPAKAREADPNSWQQPGAALVQALSDNFDVFGFSYAQTSAVDWVCHARGLQNAIRTLTAAGYSELVLIGHSAGGLIARHFVENYPDAGVTKVLTVATPHEGSFWASLPQVSLPRTQIPFIKSLTSEFRTSEKVSSRDFPRQIQCCCVVCEVPKLGGDAVVSLASQWPTEFQKQGIPMAKLQGNHFEAMRKPDAVKLLVELSTEKLRRWSPEEVDAARKALKANSTMIEKKP